jgi:FAD-linked sulfhydryl oxidase
VNKKLKKELFDCSKIGDFYDCGCADDEKGEKNQVKSADEASHTESEESARKPQLELERDGYVHVFDM